ncbi:MAG: nitrite/sulfite reductase [Enterocloster sp.]
MLTAIKPEEWKEDYKDFAEATGKFYRKEIDAKTYKGISGGFGSYAQKGGQASMLRLRMPAGRINMEKLKFIADSVAKYDISKVHFTTCQTVQLHNLSEAAVCDLSVSALSCGIVTRGGGGDFPRNVMASPLAGVEKNEYFDVMPYALAASEFLMGYIRGPKLPRKLKVCFSGSPENIPHATFRDMGFAARPDGCFDVYTAGGLGNNPKFGVKVAEAVKPDQILYYIQAMYDTFRAYGNYDNRAKARTRYMQDVLGGPEDYRKAYQEKLDAVYASGEDLTLTEEMLGQSGEPAAKAADGEAPDDRRVSAQKQTGLFSVHYHPVGGCPKPDFFGKLYDVIGEMDQAELRLAPDESVYIINLTGAEAARVLEATDDSAATLFEESVACIGASICQQGVRDSQELLRSLVAMEQEEGFADGVLPQIHISGCPSSCGTHQTGIIGFHGGVKLIDKVAVPAFTLHYNGCDKQGSERMGENLGVILQKDIPEFMRTLGKAVTESGMDFEGWMEKHPEGVKEIAGAFLA